MPTATCSCGALRATVPAYSAAVVACHCGACQRRSGSPFGLASYYPHSDVSTDGEARTWTRPTASGGIFEQFFCANCGATVWFTNTNRPGVAGVPAGAFADPDHPPPIRSVWEEREHRWIRVSAPAHFERSVAEGAWDGRP